MKHVLAIAAAVSTGAATLLLGIAAFVVTTMGQTDNSVAGQSPEATPGTIAALAPLLVVLTAVSLTMMMVSISIAVRSKPSQT